MQSTTEPFRSRAAVVRVQCLGGERGSLLISLFVGTGHLLQFLGEPSWRAACFWVSVPRSALPPFLWRFFPHGAWAVRVLLCVGRLGGGRI